MISTRIKGFIASAGFDLRKRHPYRSPAMLMANKAKELHVDTILDVGANRGQFGIELRHAGWEGRIVSFEPVSSSHAELSQAASGLWEVVPRCAVGREAGELPINVSMNSVSSSLLPVMQRSTDVAPKSAYAETEVVPVFPLDSLLQERWGGRLALKIDTQGYEGEVLAGAPRTLDRCHVVVIEISLTELYAGAPSAATILRLMEDAGFCCIAITEGFSDVKRNEMLQVDGTFVRR